ncbi:hypothetical protein O181_115369 [Austropuccinia psidii MF-1]|uniref:Uncharacterized protein n=1 Tax=Austropuccinia psidii MF-1 TaxID=1389203 RepID=A0A9Q3K710_9BASI|nr:hypothetical protein [Austropuccinia psidii MF-1]
MSHTLTYHSIQNVQLCHHHFGKGIVPYAPAHAATQADAQAHANATAPAGTHTYARPQAHLTCGIVRRALTVSSAK